MRRREQRGSAMVEAALCLAVFTPIVLAGLRLAYGANQMHQLADAVTAAARAGGACASEADIRRVAVGHLPGLDPANVIVTINRANQPALIRVSIEHFKVQRLTSAEPLSQAPSATFPYACE